MKRNVLLVVVAIAMAAFGSLANAQEFQSLQDAAAAGRDIRDYPVRDLPTPVTHAAPAGCTEHTTLSSFQTACAGAVREDLEAPGVPPGTLLGFDGPLTANGAGPYAPGDIRAGLSIDSQPPRGPGGFGLAVENQAGFGTTSACVISNFFVDQHRIRFVDENSGACEPAQCAGVAPVTLAGGATVTIDTLDCAGTSTSSTAGVSAPANGSGFRGWVCGGCDIGGLNVFDPANGAEGTTDIYRFAEADGATCGSPSPSPTPSPTPGPAPAPAPSPGPSPSPSPGTGAPALTGTGMGIMIAILLVASVVLLRRRIS
jgi:hypothetical protein